MKNQTPKPKRAYNSTARRLQSEQTRRSILEAARKLFLERGYDGTTIQAIAAEAGVAPETIYAIFGSKLAMLQKILQAGLTGDYKPVSFLEREHIQENLRNPDQKNLIFLFAKDIYQIMTRISPVFTLLRVTARTNPEISVYLKELLEERRQAMNKVVAALQRAGPLRENLSAEQARDTIWALSSAEMFDLLTHDLQYTEEQYVSWLSSSLYRLLLPAD